MYKNVDKYFRTDQSIVCEMTEKQRGFLLGLIMEFKPRKVVEIGVAEGGTTYYIMEALQHLNNDARMYSIDLSEQCLDEKDKPIGYVFRDRKELLKNQNNHTMITGKILPQVIDEIGGDVDFVILDTIHYLPGENLDFLCIFPYLSENAIVVLHDTVLSVSYNEAIATGVLFGCVSAEKYYEHEDDMDSANIAAFRITSETKRNIENSFFALTLPWYYMPSEMELKLYEDIYLKHYDRECVQLFKDACSLQKKRLDKRIEKLKRELLPKIEGRDVYLYGAGDFSERLNKTLINLGVQTAGKVVTRKSANSKDIDNIYDRETYIRRIKNNKTVLLYAIKNLEPYYELLADGICVVLIPKEYF